MLHQPLRYLAPLLLASLALDLTAAEIDYGRDIQPILAEYCFVCHGPDANTREADLRLDLQESARAVLTASGNQPAEFMARIETTDPDRVMPPPSVKKQPTDRQRQLLIAWLNAGADYQLHWSFSEVVRPEPPHLQNASWCSNQIDQFVLGNLQQAGMNPSDRATPLVQLRRLTLDLTGLPPSPEQRKHFSKQMRQQGESYARAQLIDRLLNSPAYAERMALPWLEAARYADTDGYQNDRYRYQHAWRDWVLMAYSEHMPYDQFVTEQLAGDLLPNPTLWQQVATGFGRNHRINSEDGSIPEEWHTENVVDRVDTFGTVFLGLTIGCARCHDHKYDPIAQREYFQLYAYFNNIAEHGVGPNNGNSPPFVPLPPDWPYLAEQQNQAIEPEPVRLRRARETAGNGLQRPQAGDEGTVMVMHELPKPRETYVLSRGQYDAPDHSQPVTPNVPEFLSFGDAPEPANRLGLARWLTDRSNPLTARVAVNRVWQQFFGIGLVESSDNLGTQGSRPINRDLLDWLAVELIESGWNLQHIQRLIVESSTYLQSSSIVSIQASHSTTAVRLSVGPRKRLDAFTLRDQALTAAGLLDSTFGGPSVKPYMPPKVWSAISNNKYVQDSGGALFRRSLYTYWRRTIPPPTMMNFNAAAREVCTVRVDPTNTPLQALTLLNNKVFVESSRNLASRMLKEKPRLRAQLVHGFRLVLARQPTRPELDLLVGCFADSLSEFRSRPNEAKELVRIGESPRSENMDVESLAAMTIVASLILNLDETINQE